MNAVLLKVMQIRNLLILRVFERKKSLNYLSVVVIGQPLTGSMEADFTTMNETCFVHSFTMESC